MPRDEDRERPRPGAGASLNAIQLWWLTRKGAR
jgi:hypothetical protein